VSVQAAGYSNPATPARPGGRQKKKVHRAFGHESGSNDVPNSSMRERGPDSGMCSMFAKARPVSRGWSDGRITRMRARRAVIKEQLARWRAESRRRR